MEKESKTFEKNFQDKISNYGDAEINFKFVGVPKEEIDYDKLDKLIDKVFRNGRFIYSVSIVIEDIRTIFKDFEEQHLEISLKNNKINKHIVFKNKKLEKYTSQEIINKTTSTHMNFGYDESKPIHQFNVIGYNSEMNVDEIIKSEFKLIENLLYIKSKELQPKERLLCQIYYYFYKEMPDFGDENIGRRIQSMMFILSRFINKYKYEHISLFGWFNCSFCDRIPVDTRYSAFISELVPLGQIRTFDSVALDEKVSKSVKIIGDLIRGFIKNEDDKEAALEQICSTIHAKHWVSIGYPESEISHRSKNSEEVVEKVLTKVREIEKRLEEEKNK